MQKDSEEIVINEKEVTFYKDTFSFIEQCTKRCFESYSKGLSQVETSVIPEDEAIDYDHWGCSILVNLGFGSIGLKLHYRSSVAREIASRRMNLPKDRVPSLILRDVIQEYLNLLMGQIKSRYGGKDIRVSLPITEPLDDLSDPRFEAIDRNAKNWKLSWSVENSMFFSCFVDLWQDIDQIGEIDSVEIESVQGKLEVF